jgi:phosphohistidine phosphatase
MVDARERRSPTIRVCGHALGREFASAFECTERERFLPGMNIYLVRHGDALSASANSERPLSALGREQAARAAHAIAERGAAIPLIHHSGILRAQQTAEIIAAVLIPAPVVELHTGLLPEEDPAIVAAELQGIQHSIALVGHLPYMRRLAGLLIHGDPEGAAADFLPATVLCCSRFGERWKTNWISAPGA